MKKIFILIISVIIYHAAAAQYPMPRYQDSVDQVPNIPDSISVLGYSCDSVKLKVKKVRKSTDDKIIYWLKTVKRKRIKYITVCDCEVAMYKRNDIITLCSYKLQIIKVGIHKQDPEL